MTTHEDPSPRSARSIRSIRAPLALAWDVLRKTSVKPDWLGGAAILAVLGVVTQLQLRTLDPLVDDDPWRASYELAFVGSLGGAALCCLSLWRSEWLMATLSRTERLLSESIALLGASLLLGLPAPLIAVLAHGLPPRMGGAALGLVLLAAQRSVLALVVRRLPLKLGPQLFALFALGWWIPACLPPSFAPAIERWLELPLRLAESGARGESARAWLFDLAPFAALVLAAGLRPPRAPRRP